MLNTDFELFFDLELNGDGEAVCILDNTCAAKHTCGKHGICPMAETYEQASTYAQVLAWLSVWPDGDQIYSFKIWQFTTMAICPIAKKIPTYVQNLPS